VAGGLPAQEQQLANVGGQDGDLACRMGGWVGWGGGGGGWLHLVSATGAPQWHEQDSTLFQLLLTFKRPVH
jgi:hypothetical protein